MKIPKNYIPGTNPYKSLPKNLLLKTRKKLLKNKNKLIQKL